MCDDFTHVLSARHLMNRRTIFKRRVTLKLEQNMSNLNYSASDMYIRFNLQAVNGKHPPMKLKQVLWPQINKNTWLGWPALPWAGQKLDKKINTNSVWSVVYYYTRSIITLWMQSHENNNTPVILILIRVTIEQHAIAERNCNMHKSNCKLNLTTLNSRRHPTTTSGSAPVFVNSADSLFIYHSEMEIFGSNKLFCSLVFYFRFGLTDCLQISDVQ